MTSLGPDQHLSGPRLSLRRVTLDDCNETYLGWLLDPEVHRYLETRWQPHTLDSIRGFVNEMSTRQDSYLLAIVAPDDQHIGNLKLGPVDPRHSCADISYFIGDKSRWGNGYATEAIAIGCTFGFDRLGLHRIQAGLYANNHGSARALEKVGFVAEGRFRRQLRGPAGWEDHLWFGLLAEEWTPPFEVGLLTGTPRCESSP